MDNKQKFFIVRVYSALSNITSNTNGISHSDYHFSLKIKDGSVITTIGDVEYSDSLPLRGNKRDRKALAKLVCEHICETWGGTFDEVLEYSQSFLKDFHKILNNGEYGRNQ